MNNIENGLLQKSYNPWGACGHSTYFVARIRVHGHDYERSDKDTLDEALDDLDEMKADFDEYDDAYVAEINADGKEIDYYD